MFCKIDILQQDLTNTMDLYGSELNELKTQNAQLALENRELHVKVEAANRILVWFFFCINWPFQNDNLNLIIITKFWNFRLMTIFRCDFKVYSYFLSLFSSKSNWFFQNEPSNDHNSTLNDLSVEVALLQTKLESVSKELEESKKKVGKCCFVFLKITRRFNSTDSVMTCQIPFPFSIIFFTTCHVPT